MAGRIMAACPFCMRSLTEPGRSCDHGACGQILCVGCAARIETDYRSICQNCFKPSTYKRIARLTTGSPTPSPPPYAYPLTLSALGMFEEADLTFSDTDGAAVLGVLNAHLFSRLVDEKKWGTTGLRDLLDARLGRPCSVFLIAGSLPVTEDWAVSETAEFLLAACKIGKTAYSVSVTTSTALAVPTQLSHVEYE